MKIGKHIRTGVPAYMGQTALGAMMERALTMGMMKANTAHGTGRLTYSPKRRKTRKKVPQRTRATADTAVQPNPTGKKYPSKFKRDLKRTPRNAPTHHCKKGRLVGRLIVRRLCRRWRPTRRPADSAAGDHHQHGQLQSAGLPASAIRARPRLYRLGYFHGHRESNYQDTHQQLSGHPSVTIRTPISNYQDTHQ